MTEEERFRRIKLLFGTMDDLGQERRRIYTAWVTGQTPAAEFNDRITENLRRTREAILSLEHLIAGASPPTD